MNQLIHSAHQQAISQMPAFAANLVRARFEATKLSEMPYQDAVNSIKELIVNCIRSIGHYNEANDQGVINFLCKGLLTDIVKTHKNLTDKELQIILSNGSRGEYKNKPDELVACNILSINLWIKKFYESTDRKMAMIDYNNRLTAPIQKPEPTPEEREIMLKNACNKAYEDFKKDGTLPYACGVIYDYFKKNKGITWTKEEREQIEKEANHNYKAKLKEKGKAEFTQDGLKAEKKRVALKWYFNKLIKKQ